MENQHRLIKGYRDLSEDDIKEMNAIKDMGNDVGEFIAGMKLNDEFDQRWVAIGATHMQQGIMALVRAVAQPESF